MGIEVKDFIQAIAGVLDGIYPDYKVYADKIGQHGYENCFYVSNTEASQKSKQIGRYEWRYAFKILFFQEADDRVAFYEWAEAMIRSFNQLQVGDDLYLPKDFKTIEVDEVFHCMFAVVFRVKEISDGPVMERLYQNRRTEDGRDKKRRW